MILKVPVTATSSPEWVRRAAEAVNALITALSGVDGRLTTLEVADAGTAAALTALDGRADALEAFTALPFTVASITLTPGALPGSPVHGMIATDIADGKLKFYDGMVWQNLY